VKKWDFSENLVALNQGIGRNHAAEMGYCSALFIHGLTALIRAEMVLEPSLLCYHGFMHTKLTSRRE
jgi:hypothetical protein